MADILIPKNVKNILNQKFNKLTVIRFSHLNENKQAVWICNCDCDKNELIRKEVKVTTSCLLKKNRGTKSCGCLKKTSPFAFKHGSTSSVEYKIWSSIKTRCYVKTHKHYANYGGRNIKMSDDWFNSFEFFLVDMGKRPSLNHQIDRINNNGNYCFENCKWSTRKEQMNNRRNTVYIEYNGIKRPLSEWSMILNIPRGTLRYRVKSGWSQDRILSKERILE